MTVRWPAAVSYPKSSIGSGVMHLWRTNKKTNLGLVPLPIRKDFLVRVVMIQLRHGWWVSFVSKLYISVKHSCEKKSNGIFASSASVCKENIHQKYAQLVCTVVVVLFIFQARTNAPLQHRNISRNTNGRHT